MKRSEVRLLEGALVDRRTALLFAVDILSVAASLVLAYRLSPWLKELIVGHAGAPLAPFKDYAWILFIVYPVHLSLLASRGLYHRGKSLNFTSTLPEILFSSALVLTVITLFIFFMKIQYISRFMVLVFSGFTVLMGTCLRALLSRADPLLMKIEGKPERLLVVGSRGRARDFLSTVEESPRVDIIGCIDTEPDNVGKNVGRTSVIAALNDPRDILSRYHPDLVVVAMPLTRIPGIDDLLTSCEEIGTPVMIMPDYHIVRRQRQPARTRMSIENYYGIPMLMLATTAYPKTALLLKRITDILFSSLILIILSPLFLVIALLVKTTSRGPVFYRWKVTGRNGREFTSHKFRTMVEDADRLKEKFLEENEMRGPVFKMKNDPRVTRLGRILRKYSLDEIPQFCSVLKGDMSLVGPRPPLRTETERFEFWQRRKLSVKPGITCLWQVNGRNDIADFREWVELDLEYIDNWTLGLDLVILLKTIPVVFRGTGR
jgi:exopolysaccharide biosynthesis polyprenyl glycosylphosphotransferase